jgi:hypothetical protein
VEGIIDMGYFANGTEGLGYEDAYCRHCIHAPTETRNCPVMECHLVFNYEHCNDEKSPLHILIPKDKKCPARRCKMYMKRSDDFRRAVRYIADRVMALKRSAIDGHAIRASDIKKLLKELPK